jgi:hypothetical protein
MSRIVQVQSGQSQVNLNKLLLDQNAKALLSDYDFAKKVTAGAFTSTLTDLGPGILLSSAVNLTNTTEDTRTLATITPGFAGRVTDAFAIVTTAVSTAAKLANVQVFVDQAAGTNEVDSLTTTGTPTGGTLTLTVNGQTTAGIAFNAAAATVQSALEALSNVAVGDVTCTGGALPTAVTITWGGNLAGQPVTVTANGAGLTGGTTPTAVVTNTTPGSLGNENSAPVAVNGGLIALTSANATPVGKIVPGSQIAFADTISPAIFSSTGSIQFRVSGAPTVFSEGAVLFGVCVEPANKTGPLAN